MNTFDTLYIKLNPEQKKAVDTIDGPVLVLAGPGTGKTQVLALRIANILKKTQMNAYNILCLTFTESAAHEMRERLTSIIGTSAYDVAIHTFHGFANSVIQEFPYTFNSQLGEEGESELVKYTQLDDFSRFKIIEDLLTKNHWDHLTPLKNNLIHLQQIAKHLQEFKRERIAPAFLEKKAQEQIAQCNALFDDEKITKTKKASIDIEIQKCKRTLELCKLYSLYDRELTRASHYDFEDMINWVVDALTNDPELALIYQEKYQYILVDEYQDTNNAQLELLRQLTSFYKDNPNLFVVGDQNQSIYRFQGASNYNIEQFKARYKKAQTVALTTNYRSGQGIIDVGSTLIQNNHTQAQQAAFLPIKTKVDVTVYLHAHQEAYEIACAIKERIKHIKPSECAVLVRRNDQIADFVHALSLEKIPFQVIKGERVLTHPFVEKILLLAHVIVDPSDPVAFAQLFYVYREHFSLRDADIIKKATFKKTKIIGLSADGKNFLQKIDDVATQIHELPLANAFIMILDTFDILKKALASANRLEKLTLLKALYNNAKEETGTLPQWLKKLHAMRTYNLDIASEPIVYGQDDAVVISTVHQAKGKEYDSVYLPQLHQNIWSKANRSIFYIPTLNAKHDEHEVQIQEERQLLYVGITRAKVNMHISYAELEKERTITPSRYLQELPEKTDVIHKNEHVENTIQRIAHQLAPLPPVSFSQIETAWIKEIVAKQALSPTGFTTYKNCPKNYLIKNILRIPQVKSASQSYGTAIHTALEHFFIAFQQSGIIPSQNDMIAYFHTALENEYQLTTVDRKKFIHDGEILLRHYYTDRSAEFTMPIHTEYSFRKVSLDGIPLSGKIDKIEWINPKEKTVRVVDYKTGHAKTRNALMGLTKDNDTDYLYQLKFYQLLSELDHSFYLKWKIGESALEFLDSEGKFSRQSFTFNRADMDELKQEIKDVWDNIQNLKFKHNPDTKYGCEFCEIFE